MLSGGAPFGEDAQPPVPGTSARAAVDWLGFVQSIRTVENEGRNARVVVVKGSMARGTAKIQLIHKVEVRRLVRT